MKNRLNTKKITTDVLIIGGGTAGCYAALVLSEQKLFFVSYKFTINTVVGTHNCPWFCFLYCAKGMLLYQGVVNYSLFTGKDFPIEEYQVTAGIDLCVCGVVWRLFCGAVPGAGRI